MSRRQRQGLSLEAAVAASPLFKLPLEIRWMIYKLLLVQDYGLAIAQDMFERRSRRSRRPRPYSCPRCGSFFIKSANLVRHERSSYKHSIRDSDPPDDPKLPDVPAIDTPILYTCRLVHDEATPILYKFNSFCFSDLRTSNDFRWSIGTENACLIEDIRFHGAIWDQKGPEWKLLSEDFPQLKRMCLRVSTPWDIEYVNFMYWQLGDLARHFRGLDWVHLLGPSALEGVEFLTPMIHRDSETGNRHVQKYGSVLPPDGMEEDEYLKQGHATIWWGRDGEQPPEGTRHMR